MNIFKDKKAVTVFLVMALIGILLMLSDNFMGNTVEITDKTDGISEYNIETKLETILSKVKGAGKVSVMITYETGKEKIIAYNTDNEKDNDLDNFSTRESSEVVINSNGPVVLKEIYPEIKGVLIVAQGGGNTEVKNNLISAAMALTGVDVNKIEVLVMKKED